MSLYNIVNPASMQAGQPEDVSQVLANFQAIQTVLNGGIDDTNIRSAAAIQPSKLANYPADATRALRGDGTWKTAPQNITSGTMAAGPPGTPQDGDIWIATAVDANGTTWMFRYNAGSASPYKWEFVGGASQITGPLGSMTLASVGEHDLTGGPTLTTVRVGDYLLGLGCVVNAPSAQYLTVHPKGSVAGNISTPEIVWSPPASFYEVGWIEALITGLAAQVLNVSCAIANNTVSTGFQSGILKLTPVRIA